MKKTVIPPAGLKFLIYFVRPISSSGKDARNRDILICILPTRQ